MKTTFTVPGRPIPKGRPRVTRYGTYTPPATRAYEEAVREAWRAAGSVSFPADVPLRLVVSAHFAPSGRPSRKTRAAMLGQPHTLHRGDLDNIVKSVMDALNGCAYPDDCAVSFIAAQKRYGAEACTVVTVSDGKEDA